MAHWPQHKHGCKAKQKMRAHLKETDHVHVDLGASLTVGRAALHQKFKQWRQASADYSFSDPM
jgi:hypothetical protein